jgi:saccharopine dehydrogenase-like NADP-dependent oxidoreductase
MSLKVAVLGATGHTGRFVVAELQRRGLTPIPIARDRGKLAALAQSFGLTAFRTADFAEAASLDAAVADTAAIINCAGPFFDTAVPAIAAALRAKIPYLDVTAEQITALTSFHRYHHAAVEAGIAILPAIAFYGGLADLMATAAMGDWQDAERISVAIALDSWHPTEGTRRTGARNTAQRYVLTDGRLDILDPSMPHVFWHFAEPFGKQEMAHVPLSEVITISRHLPVHEIVSLMNLVPLKDLRDPGTPPPAPADSRGRSDQRFAVEVKAERRGEARQVSLTGQDIYAFSAELVAEAASWLCDGRIRQTGALAAGMAVNPNQFLDAVCDRSS